MHDEELFRTIEQRLRDEAQSLLGDDPQKPWIDGLKTRFIRCNRRRNLVRALSAASIVVAIGLIGNHVMRRPGNPVQNIATGVDSPHPAENIVAAPSTASDVLSSRENSLVHESPESHGKFIPAVFLMTRSDGTSELAVGWYIPERIETIDDGDFSSGEREAISHLLGMDFDFPKDETI